MVVVVLQAVQVDEDLAPIIGDFDRDGFAVGKVVAVRKHSECPFPTRKGHHKRPKNSPFFLTGAFGSFLNICLVWTKKMHELRGAQVTSVGFESHHLHVLRFRFVLFVFGG